MKSTIRRAWRGVRLMAKFSVRFARCFRYVVDAETADAAAEKITTAYRSIDYNLQLGLGEKVACKAGAEFEDFFAFAECEHEIEVEEDEEAEGATTEAAPSV
jgi:hypothetical protein